MISGIYAKAAARADGSQFNTEEYGRFAENDFLSVVDNPLSTFSGAYLWLTRDREATR